jgi:hypothetical protein
MSKKVVENKKSGFGRKLLTRLNLGYLLRYENVVLKMPFILFIAALSALYISNNHKAVIYVGKISHLEEEVEELSWHYETVHSELTYRSTLSAVAQMVDSMGLKKLDEPQFKITPSEDGR